MNAYANIAKEVKDALEKNSMTKKLLSFDMVVLFASIGLQLFFWLLNMWSPWVFLSNFLNLFRTVFFVVMLGGMVLTFANRKDQMLAIGCWAYAGFNFIIFIRKLLNLYAHYLDLSLLFQIVVWVGLGLSAFFVANPDKMPKFGKPASASIPPRQNESAPQWNNGASQQNAAPQWNNGASQQNAAPQWNNGASQQNAAPQWNNGASQQNAAPQWNNGASQQNAAPQWNNGVSQQNPVPKTENPVQENSATEPAAPAVCSICGAEISEGGKFCSSCGAKM